MGNYFSSYSDSTNSSTPEIETASKAFLKNIYDRFQSRSLDGVSFCWVVINLILGKKPSSIVIASGGEQSLGKSYFLNQHFGCKFAFKETVDHGKMTMNANSFEVDDLCILDLEGIDSSDNSTDRENQNITLSLAFSDIYMLHIPHNKLQSKIIERFSYSYWHAIKILGKVNKSLPKIFILIRDPSISLTKDDKENFKNIQNSIIKFEAQVNLKLEEYNESIIKYITQDQSFKTMSTELKNNLIKRCTPNIHRYKFKVAGFHPVFYNSQNQVYINRKNNSYVEFDPREFRNKLNPFIKEIEKANSLKQRNRNEQILRDSVYDEALSQKMGLNKIIKNELITFFGGEEVSKYFLTDFCIEMELDHNLSYKTFDEYKNSLIIMEKYIEVAKNNEIDSLKRIKHDTSKNFSCLKKSI